MNMREEHAAWARLVRERIDERQQELKLDIITRQPIDLDGRLGQLVIWPWPLLLLPLCGLGTRRSPTLVERAEGPLPGMVATDHL